MTIAAEPATLVVPHRALITGSTMLATLMQTLDSTIANVALPHMQGSLSAAQDQISWVLTSYIVAAAVATPLTGWLVGRFGRKRVFLLSIAGFTVASLLCGIAGSLAQIVCFRLLQGVFGASLVPLSQAILLDINPREKHGSAMAIWGMGVMVGPVIGPTLGGWLTDTYDWRWVFYINLPVGIVAFAGVWFFLGETAKNLARRFDVFGFVMLSLGIGALQMMLDRGETNDWFSVTETWIELGLAIAGIWVFLIHAATAPNPFVSLAMFKDRNFGTGCAMMFLTGLVLYSVQALLPTFLQSLMNYPVVTSGNILAPRGIGTMVGMLIVGRASGKFDTRVLLLLGLLLSAYSLWQMTGYSLDMDWWPIVSAGIIQGFGMGLVFVPLSMMTFATLPSSMRNEASSFYSLVRNIGGSIGISLAENVFSRAVQTNHAALAEHASPFNGPLVMPGVQQAWNLHSHAGLAALDAEINRQASMLAYVDDFELIMVLTLVMVPFLFLMKKPRMTGAPAAVAMD